MYTHIHTLHLTVYVPPLSFPQSVCEHALVISRVFGVAVIIIFFFWRAVDYHDWEKKKEEREHWQYLTAWKLHWSAGWVQVNDLLQQVNSFHSCKTKLLRSEWQIVVALLVMTAWRVLLTLCSRRPFLLFALCHVNTYSVQNNCKHHTPALKKKKEAQKANLWWMELCECSDGMCVRIQCAHQQFSPPLTFYFWKKKFFFFFASST